MKFDDISIRRSAIPSVGGRFHLEAEIGGMKFDLWFDDLGGFLQAVHDLGGAMAVRLGKARAQDSRFLASRDMAPGVIGRD